MTVRKQTSIVFSFLKLKQTETVRNKFAVWGAQQAAGALRA